MGLLSLLRENPIAFIIVAPVLLFSLAAHELAHGWVAYFYGDKTAMYEGRLSFNPIRHLDPIGTIAIFLVGFGWAKPVPVDYRNFNNPSKAIISVSLAGCATNFLIAALALSLLLFNFIFYNPVLLAVLFITAKINIILGTLNLMPIPPLDGSRVVMEFLPVSAKYKFAKIEQYFMIILVVLVFTGLLDPIFDFIHKSLMIYLRFASDFNAG